MKYLRIVFIILIIATGLFIGYLLLTNREVFQKLRKGEPQKTTQQLGTEAKQKLSSLLPQTTKDFSVSSKTVNGKIEGFLVTTISAQGKEKAEGWLKEKGFTDLAILNLEFKTSEEIRAIPESYD